MMIRYLGFLFLVLILFSSCQQNFKVEETKWFSDEQMQLSIDANLNAELFIILPERTVTRKYKFEKITDDSLVYMSSYKDSIVPGGYIKLINENELIFCNRKTSPTRSGNIDHVSWFFRNRSNVSNKHSSSIVFPQKKGRYVLEYIDDRIDNTCTDNREYKFQSVHLKTKNKLCTQDISKNDYHFYWGNQANPLPIYNFRADYDSLLQVNEDSLFVYRMGMNHFSHYKIYVFDSIVVQNDAEYFFVGRLKEIVNHDIHGSY